MPTPSVSPQGRFVSPFLGVSSDRPVFGIFNPTAKIVKFGQKSAKISDFRTGSARGKGAKFKFILCCGRDVPRKGMGNPVGGQAYPLL